MVKLYVSTGGPAEAVLRTPSLRRLLHFYIVNTKHTDNSKHLASQIISGTCEKHHVEGDDEGDLRHHSLRVVATTAVVAITDNENGDRASHHRKHRSTITQTSCLPLLTPCTHGRRSRVHTDTGVGVR